MTASIVQGRADAPVYILRSRMSRCSILPADAPVGQDHRRGAGRCLHETHSDKVTRTAVRPGRREACRYANITADLRNFHGRGGLGAVMGSKNLRAIVVRGSHRKLKIADPVGLNKIATWFARSTKVSLASTCTMSLAPPRASCRSVFRASCRPIISRMVPSKVPKRSAAKR